MGHTEDELKETNTNIDGDNEDLLSTKDQLDELNNKYLRLLADFDNYKKRVQKEKEDLKNKTKIDLLSSILEIDSDLSIAKKSIKDDGINLIIGKLSTYLKLHGIEEIQTNTYDSDLHEVVAVMEEGTNIIDVISKGYSINGKPFKYPKVILGK